MPRNSCALALSVATLAACLTLAPSAIAGLPLFNTGVNAVGVPLPDNTLGDPHYTLITSPNPASDNIRVRTSVGGYPITTDPIVGDWLPDNSTSAWLATYNGANSSVAGGTYTYRTTFDIPFAPANPITITGRWSADNAGTDILLNGASTNNSAIPVFNPVFESWYPFTINAPAHQGLNTIDFVTSNDYAPTGVRVEFLTANLPEPTTLSLLTLALPLATRRRRY